MHEKIWNILYIWWGFSRGLWGHVTQRLPSRFVYVWDPYKILSFIELFACFFSKNNTLFNEFFLIILAKLKQISTSFNPSNMRTCRNNNEKRKVMITVLWKFQPLQYGRWSFLCATNPGPLVCRTVESPWFTSSNCASSNKVGVVRTRNFVFDTNNEREECEKHSSSHKKNLKICIYLNSNLRNMTSKRKPKKEVFLT